MANIIPPRRGEVLTNDGSGTNRFNEYLERLTSQTNESTEEIESSSVESESENTALLSSKIHVLTSRVEDVEELSFNDELNSRVSRIDAKVTRLIDELIDVIKNGRTDALADESLSTQHETLKNLKLLNARIEEAHETGIDEDDV